MNNDRRSTGYNRHNGHKRDGGRGGGGRDNDSETFNSIDHIACKLRKGNITYVIQPNEFEQQTDENNNEISSKNRVTATQDLKRVFEQLVDISFPDKFTSTSSPMSQSITTTRSQKQRREIKNDRDPSSKNCTMPPFRNSDGAVKNSFHDGSNIRHTYAIPLEQRRLQHLPDKNELLHPPPFLSSNTIMYWLMMRCCPERSLISVEDAEDVTDAVKDYRNEFVSKLSSDQMFTRNYTYPDDNKKSNSHKVCSETLLRCLHHPNWDVLLHDAIPTYACDLYGISITLIDVRGVCHRFSLSTVEKTNEKQHSHLKLVQNINGTMSLQLCQ